MINLKKLKTFIDKYEEGKPPNSVKIYFSRKMPSKYSSHLPSASNEVQQSIVATVLPYVKAQVLNNSMVEYNAIGVADGEIEKMKTNQIPMIQEFYNSISDEQVYKDMESLKIDKIGFYCISLVCDDQNLMLFRQFQKLKKLRKGFLACIMHNELTAMETDFLGVDETVDMAIFEDNVYILNHVSLERIFEYKDEFLKKTNEALGEILSRNIIANIEQFADDCLHDIRIAKRFTNIMSKGRLPLFFDNYDRVQEIVSELDLDIDFDDDGRLVYRERSQLFHIISLFSDSYFKSLLAQRTGIAKIEAEL